MTAVQDTAPLPPPASPPEPGTPQLSKPRARPAYTSATASSSKRGPPASDAPQPPAKTRKTSGLTAKPASSRANSGGAGGRSSSNYSDPEVTKILDLVAKHKPQAGEGWDKVYDRYAIWAEENQLSLRNVKFVKDKFNKLVMTEPLTGNAKPHPHVTRAIKISEELEGGKHIRQIDDTTASPARTPSPSHDTPRAPSPDSRGLSRSRLRDTSRACACTHDAVTQDVNNEVVEVSDSEAAPVKKPKAEVTPARAQHIVGKGAVSSSSSSTKPTPSGKRARDAETAALAGNLNSALDPVAHAERQDARDFCCDLRDKDNRITHLQDEVTALRLENTSLKMEIKNTENFQMLQKLFMQSVPSFPHSAPVFPSPAMPPQPQYHSPAVPGPSRTPYPYHNYHARHHHSQSPVCLSLLSDLDIQKLDYELALMPPPAGPLSPFGSIQNLPLATGHSPARHTPVTPVIKRPSQNVWTFPTTIVDAMHRNDSPTCSTCRLQEEAAEALTGLSSVAKGKQRALY
ncbi:hypothetical protein FA95DRAFT_1561522 [Auriscalpium vulgare]|uniref:Uncharacterized protein n=1 Tax=Auriscalpium vulgare TaxID=40419 RepID=A0ACB8RLC2_9AGAM|nr:hypothetical protein FA95DRAFT_1561522 [Auriscalpium vulgare]